MVLCLTLLGFVGIGLDFRLSFWGATMVTFEDVLRIILLWAYFNLVTLWVLLG